MTDLKAVLKDIVTSSIHPALKAAGFRKSGRRFNRDYGATHQVIDLQLSQGNSAFTIKFYVNVGVGLPLVWDFEGRHHKAPAKPHECHVSTRLDEIVSDAPTHFDLVHGQDGTALEAQIGPLVSRLLDRLAPINTPEALLDVPWLTNHRTRASILYCLNRDAEALDALKAWEVKFADRKNSAVADSIRILKLARLG